MAASFADIAGWVNKGKQQGCTHVLVVCDTFDWEDYPVYVTKEEDIKERLEHYSGNMQKVMEVYKMDMNLDAQLAEHRAWNV